MRYAYCFEKIPTSDDFAKVGVALMSSALRFSATKRNKENEKRPLF
jgi:hypothetical protein